ncbi:MAG: hypothetical protein QM695_07620 [Micropruina sp.]
MPSRSRPGWSRSSPKAPARAAFSAGVGWGMGCPLNGFAAAVAAVAAPNDGRPGASVQPKPSTAQACWAASVPSTEAR